VLGKGRVSREVWGGVDFERYAEEKVHGFAGVGAAAVARDVRPERGFGAGAGSVAGTDRGDRQFAGGGGADGHGLHDRLEAREDAESTISVAGGGGPARGPDWRRSSSHRDGEAGGGPVSPDGGAEPGRHSGRLSRVRDSFEAGNAAGCAWAECRGWRVETAPSKSQLAICRQPQPIPFAITPETTKAARAKAERERRTRSTAFPAMNREAAGGLPDGSGWVSSRG